MAHLKRERAPLGKFLAGLAASAVFLTACQTAAPVSQVDTDTQQAARSPADLDAKRQAKANAPCPEYGRGSGSFEPPFPTSCAGLQTTESGLRWIEIAAGPEDRESPLDGATVIVAYEGYLESTGAKFDSSYDRGEAAVFVIDQVIAGWTEILQQMTPGDEWLVYIPAGLAYGGASPSPAIPANADLVFKIRLDGFLNAEEVAGLPPPAGVSPALWNDFLPWDRNREGIQREISGLTYFEIEDGGDTNVNPRADDLVAIDYEARIAETGALVASTWGRQTPLVVRAGDLIPGFAQLLSLMEQGDVFIGHLPPPLAYGDAGLDDIVAPGADLVYLVNLIAINPEISGTED